MVISKAQFYGYKLKKEILNAEDYQALDPVFLKTFYNAIDNLPKDLDEDKFLDFIEYNFDSLNKVCFYILVSKLGNNILNKDIYYISDLCVALAIRKVPTNQFIKMAEVLVTDQIYNLINKITEEYSYYDNFSLLIIIITYFMTNPDTTLDIPNVSELLKILTTENYNILFNSEDSLEKIYLILRKNMREINASEPTYTKKDFQIIANPDHFGANIKEALRQELIAEENNSYDLKTRIDISLKIIYKYNNNIYSILVRRQNSWKKKTTLIIFILTYIN